MSNKYYHGSQLKEDMSANYIKQSYGTNRGIQPVVNLIKSKMNDLQSIIDTREISEKIERAKNDIDRYISEIESNDLSHIKELRTNNQKDSVVLNKLNDISILLHNIGHGNKVLDEKRNYNVSDSILAVGDIVNQVLRNYKYNPTIA